MPDGVGNNPTTIFESLGQKAQQGAQQVGNTAKTFGQTAGGQIFGTQKPTQQSQGQVGQGGFPKMPPSPDSLGKMPGFEKMMGGKPLPGQKQSYQDPSKDPTYLQEVREEQQQTQAKLMQLRQQLHEMEIKPVMTAGENMMEKRRQEQAKQEQMEAEQKKQQEEEERQAMQQSLPNTGSKSTGPGAQQQIQKSATKTEIKGGRTG